MEGWTAGGGAWRCVVGGRGEGPRRAGPALPARGLSLRPGLGARVGAAGAGPAGWGVSGRADADPGPRPFGAGPGRAGRGLARGAVS